MRIISKVGRKLKVVLVNPIFEGKVFAPTLGLGFIGTYLREHSNCEVQVIEPLLQGLTRTQVLGMAQESDIVGLTCYTESRFEVFKFALDTKKVNPECRLVVGGPHVNTLDEAILQYYPFIDTVVRGEGEASFLDIVEGRRPKEIPGITWRTDGGIIRNPDRSPIRDIDSLHYDYSFLPELKKWKDFEVPQELIGLNAFPIIASRGCPFRCTFCAAHEQWDKVYRVLSPVELVRRLKSLVNTYNIRYFRFYDALFMFDEKKVLEFSNLLKESGLEISFRIDIRAGMSKKTLEVLREVGCTIVGVGIESGSNKVLKRIKKGISREQIEETIEICRELKYWAIGYFMVSLPDETLEDFGKTLELPRFFDGINLQFFKIHPGTSCYSELKLKNEINDGIWFDQRYGNEIYYCKELFPSAGFSLSEGMTLFHRIYYNYYNHNRRRTFQTFGKTRGISVFLLSTVMDKILRSNKISRRLYPKLLQTNLPGMFQRWLTKDLRK